MRDPRATKATENAPAALLRLLTLAETRNSGQIAKVAAFLASIYNSRAFPFDLYCLRSLDIAISDDMLTLIDALRWGVIDPHEQIDNGAKRIEAVIELWGLTWPA